LRAFDRVYWAGARTPPLDPNGCPRFVCATDRHRRLVSRSNRSPGGLGGLEELGRRLDRPNRGIFRRGESRAQERASPIGFRGAAHYFGGPRSRLVAVRQAHRTTPEGDSRAGGDVPGRFASPLPRAGPGARKPVLVLFGFTGKIASPSVLGGKSAETKILPAAKRFFFAFFVVFPVRFCMSRGDP